MRFPRIVVAIVFALAGMSTPSAADAARLPCGADGCAVAGGRYHLALPEALPEAGIGPIPAIVYFHGYGGQAASLMRGDLADRTTARGYALIAPQGTRLPERRATNWTVPNDDGGGSRSGRDDVAFVERVMADAAGRFALDRDRVLAAGFSLGGMFVWHLACRHGEAFAAYAPVAGAIWAPLPTTCPGGPVPLLHSHGFADRTVPLEGRPVADGRLAQGDVFESLSLLRRVNGCDSQAPSRHHGVASFQCRHWEGCDGPPIGFCLHPGGHRVAPGWTDLALDWFESLGITGTPAQR